MTETLYFVPGWRPSKSVRDVELEKVHSIGKATLLTEYDEIGVAVTWYSWMTPLETSGASGEKKLIWKMSLNVYKIKLNLYNIHPQVIFKVFSFLLIKESDLGGPETKIKLRNSS